MEDTGRREKGWGDAGSEDWKGLLERGSVERFRDWKCSFTKTGGLEQYTPGTEHIKR